MQVLPQQAPRTLVVGASRGIGAAVAEHYRRQGHDLVLASRTPPEDAGDEWVACDVRRLEHLQALAHHVQGRPLANLVYNVGEWETEAFDVTPLQELSDVMAACSSGAVLLARLLLDEIRAGQGLLLLVGSTCGLENEGSSAVAYTTGKFGLRGAGHALREVLRDSGVRVTCLNIGSTASDMPFAEVQDVLARYDGKRMPVQDVVSVVALLGTLSPAACLKEIDMPAQYDRDV